MEQDIYHTFERYLNQELSPDEQTRLEDRLRNEPELGQALQTFVQAHAAIQAQGDALLKAKLIQQGHSLLARKPGQVRPMRRYWLIAAAAVVLLLLGTFLLPRFFAGPASLPELYLAQFERPTMPMTQTRSSEEANLSAQWTEAALAFEAENYSVAVAALQSYLQSRNDSEAFFFLGVSQLMLQQAIPAAESFQAISPESASYPKAQWYLALSYLQADDLSASRTQLQTIAQDSSHYRHEQAATLLKKLDQR